MSVCAIRAFSVSSRAAISACSTARWRSISIDCVSRTFWMPVSVPAFSCGLRARSIDSPSALPAVGRLACGNLGVLASRLTRGRGPTDIFLAPGTRLSEDERLRHLGLLGFLAGGDLGLLDGALAVDLQRLRFAILLDARLRHGLFLQDARTLDRFTCRDLGS